MIEILSIDDSLIFIIVTIHKGEFEWDLTVFFSGRTKLEPVSIVIISVIMSLASVQMIRESIEMIIFYASDNESGPSMGIFTITIGVITISK